MDTNFKAFLIAVCASAVIYLIVRGAIKLWFSEKEKHLTRVLKKMEEENNRE